MEELLNLKSARITEQQNTQVQVQVASNLGTYEVIKVPTMLPKALRSGVESVLRIDKAYKTVQQMDLSSFSQVKEEQELYWNLVFWFKYTQLPYLWLAPYVQHLQGPADILSNNN